MKPLRAVVATIVVAASLTLACSGMGGDAIVLNSTEAMLLYQEINLIFLRAHLARTNPTLSRTAHAPRSNAGISLSELVTLHGYIPCKGGGMATIDGDDNSNPQFRAFDFSVTYQGCMTDDFQLDGPYHQVLKTPDLNTSNTTGTGDLNISVRADGRSGPCHLDFTYTVTGTGITATGTICGVNATTALH